MSTKKKPTNKDIVFKITIGISVLAGIVLGLLAQNSGTFFQGALLKLTPSFTVEEPETTIESETPLGTIVAHYVKEENEVILDSNALTIPIWHMKFDIMHEEIALNSIVLLKQGEINSENFSNLVFTTNGEKTEITTLWDEDSLVITFIEPLILNVGTQELQLSADIIDAKSGFSFAFHFSDMNAGGVETKKKITRYGINGEAVPTPQIFGIK